MSAPPAPPASHRAAAQPGAPAIAAAALLALAVAMGIGRFAFTPMLPLMMRDGLLDAALAAELAAANYLGYLAGAISAAPLQAWLAQRRPPRNADQPPALLPLALALVIALNAAMAGPNLLGIGWHALRALAGAASAWTLVAATGWALTVLARRGAAALGSWVFAGVGGGIALSGLLVWALGAWPAAALWQALTALALVLAGAMAWLLRAPAAGAGPAQAGNRSAHGATAAVASQASAASPAPAANTGHLAAAASQRRGVPAGFGPLVFCYGSFGFGYIVPATFLPAMARALVDDPFWFGLAWPVFGLAAVLSIALSARLASHWPRQPLWAGCQLAMAAGVALPLLSRSGLAIGAAALLVGGSFMVATMAGMQLARQWLPADPTPLLGRMTTAFAAGQILGPLQVRLLDGWHWQGWGPIEFTSATAAVLLAATAAWLWRGLPDPAQPSHPNQSARHAHPPR